MIALNSNDFEIFALPAVYQIDLAELDVRWKDLLRQTHPDKFSNQGAAAQRVSMQWSVRINEAYKRLKNPVSRAAYLCQINGFSIDAESNTAMPAEFLMQQMQWREELEEAQTSERLQELQLRISSSYSQYCDLLTRQIDHEHNHRAAAQTVRSLMFIERLQQDIEQRLD